MAERYDAVILGMGSGGELAAGKLLSGGMSVAVVEKELIGGECAYWACIPSKTLLRPPEIRGEASKAFGTDTPTLELEDLFDHRDWMIRNLDDSKQVEGFEGKAARVIKGEGRITGPGKVEANGQTLETDNIVVATGSAPNVPPIEGLEDVPYWTNREATTTREVPGRAVVVGGGANGVEASQWLNRFGTEVTLVQSSDRLVNREDPQVGELARSFLEEEGIEIMLGQRATRARRDGDSTVVELEDGTEIETDVIVVAAGRTPRVEGIGLESIGVEPDEKGLLPIDDHCRVDGAPGVWALGDVTGVMLYTHVATYQARSVGDNILGKERRADYRSIPRVAFTDPEIAAAGLTEGLGKGAGDRRRERDAGHDKGARPPLDLREEPVRELRARGRPGAGGLGGGVGHRPAGRRVDPPGLPGHPGPDPHRDAARRRVPVPNLLRSVPQNASAAGPLANARGRTEGGRLKLREAIADVGIGAIGGYLGTQVMERVAMKLYEWEPEEARQQEDEARSGDPFIVVPSIRKIRVAVCVGIV